eukprot:CAMPEP_0198275756 /NCGR_PEP_ID=MMETSP1447-20131203/64942_1 /TAXON_ID=420782 /ORGANISM="Chaetoceros dichaeta, Strain CCMP1751" /LENGTH=478 /DNA_ID=CAMNT_0043970651 /DNA_START=547 /DNA_END=1983 /DNA_ORIENTATION=+
MVSTREFRTTIKEMFILQKVIFVSIWSSLLLAKGVVAEHCCECLRECRDNPDLQQNKNCLEECHCNDGDSDEVEDLQCTDEPNMSDTSTPSTSPAPSDTPSVSAAPTRTYAPTVTCTCCDCTATSGCVPDPHYYTWSAPWYDFQGSCDQIAITNDILELQIQTRGTGYYSTVSQLALYMKGTGEVFKINRNNDVQNGITPASGATYSNSGFVHTVTFDTPTDNVSFIKVTSSTNYGMSVQVQGQGWIFSGSEGMFGSWNNGGARFQNGTVFDLTGSYSDKKARSIELAKSWKVSAADNKMHAHSDICVASSAIIGGPDPGNRRLDDGVIKPLIDNCNKTCADIPDHTGVSNVFCEQDVELTNDDSWACQPVYREPIIIVPDTCQFITEDDNKCEKDGDACQRLGGYCKVNCEDTEDHVCLTNLCSRKYPFEKPKKKNDKPKGKGKNEKVAKSPKVGNPNGKGCKCFVPVACSGDPALL